VDQHRRFSLNCRPKPSRRCRTYAKTISWDEVSAYLWLGPKVTTVHLLPATSFMRLENLWNVVMVVRTFRRLEKNRHRHSTCPHHVTTAISERQICNLARTTQRNHFSLLEKGPVSSLCFAVCCLASFRWHRITAEIACHDMYTLIPG
jgi:hypothetical protein